MCSCEERRWHPPNCNRHDDSEAGFENRLLFSESGHDQLLELNGDKCELYFCNGQVVDVIVNEFKRLAPGIRVVTDDELEVLGSPLMDTGIENFARRKFEKILVLINRLSSLQTHYAYFVLKNCIAIPKLTFLLRTTPLWKFPNLLTDMDMKIKTALEKITNVGLNSTQWTQSSLPVNFGGLGIRSLLDISLPAYLSSVCGVKDIVSTLTITKDYESEMPHYAEAMMKWNEINHGTVPENQKSQFFWDEINTKRIVSELEMPNDIEQFRFQLLQNKFSGAWLNVIPSPNIGTFLNNDVMRTCIGLRLGTKICHPFMCECGVPVDSLGRHGISCKKNYGKYFRHAASINMSSLLEPTGLFRDDENKRPDGITYTAYERGRAMVWDSTCADSLAASNMAGRSKKPGMASEKAAARKHSKYTKIKANYHFIAFAVESLGPWSKDAIDFINKVGSNLKRITGEPKSKHYLIQRVSLAIQQGNALSIISSIPKSSTLDEIYMLQ